MAKQKEVKPYTCIYRERRNNRAQEYQSIIYETSRLRAEKKAREIYNKESGYSVVEVFLGGE